MAGIVPFLLTPRSRKINSAAPQAPHRRLWMGPQFTFRRYDEFENDGAINATCLTSPITFKRPAPVLVAATPQNGTAPAGAGRAADTPSPEEIQNDIAEAMGL